MTLQHETENNVKQAQSIPETKEPNNNLAAAFVGTPRLTGTEPPLLDVDIEEKGVVDVLEALTEEEMTYLADGNMPLRHFRAEKGNTEKAIAKIKATLKWRKEFEVEKIITCTMEGGDEEMSKIIHHENETGKVYVRGYDKTGRAVVILRPAVDNTGHEQNQMRHLVYHLERGIACTAKKSGKEKIVILIDYEGFKLRNAPPMSTTRHTLDILQNHYPERLHRFYLLNPPFVFRAFWNLTKPFIDPVTKGKVNFCHGKAGEKVMEENFDLAKMETCAYGTGAARDFDSVEYLSTPMDTTFDE